MSKKMRQSTRGFTLVELLVVIAIIGILIGMLLPAVQQVREAARRSQCQNQMRQLSLAMLNYESANQHFPPGISSRSDADATPSNRLKSKGFSWGAIILPYMEQGSLHDFLGDGSDNFVTPNWGSGLNENIIETYVCPTCPMDSENPLRPEGAKSNYVGVLGPKWEEKDLEDVTNRSWYSLVETGAVSTNDERVTLQFPGILFFDSNIGFGDIGDGSSNTFLIGERDGGPLNSDSSGRDWNRAASAWVGANEAQWLNSVLGPTSATPRWTLNSAQGDFWTQWVPFSSSHPGGANFGRADGSVTFVSETVDGDTYEAMGTRNGGESFDPL